MSAHPPTRRTLLIQRLVLRAGTAMLLAGGSAACATAPAPSARADDRVVLVVADGQVRGLDPDGGWLAVDGPGDAVAVVATGGRIVVVTADGIAWRSGVVPGPRWTALAAAVGVPGAAPLVAIDPEGSRLVAAIGDAQGSRLELVEIDLQRGAETRRTSVARGLNGPPSWIAPGVAMNVITPNGTSALAAIELGTGAVRDRIGPGIEVVGSSDARTVAVIDGQGAVRVGDAASWQAGQLDRLVPLGASDAPPAERVAISRDGRRVAIVRRDGADQAGIETWLRDDATWRPGPTIARVTSGSVSVAWSSAS